MNFVTDNPKNQISIGTAFLLYVTLAAIALSVGMGSYVICLHQEMPLKTSGYLPWSGSLRWGDFLSIPYYWISCGANIWFRYQPGITLGFVFLNNPLMIALRSGFIVLIAEIIASLALVRWYQNETRFPLFLCLLSFSILGFGIYGCFPGVPDSFYLDIGNNKISRLLNQSDDSIRLSDATHVSARTIGRGFSITACQRLAYCHVYTRIFVQTNSSSNFDLVTLSSKTQGAQIQALTNDFLSSHGNTL